MERPEDGELRARFCSHARAAAWTPNDADFSRSTEDPFSAPQEPSDRWQSHLPLGKAALCGRAGPCSPVLPKLLSFPCPIPFHGLEVVHQAGKPRLPAAAPPSRVPPHKTQMLKPRPRGQRCIGPPASGAGIPAQVCAQAESAIIRTGHEQDACAADSRASGTQWPVKV